MDLRIRLKHPAPSQRYIHGPVEGGTKIAAQLATGDEKLPAGTEYEWWVQDGSGIELHRSRATSALLELPSVTTDTLIEIGVDLVTPDGEGLEADTTLEVVPAGTLEQHTEFLDTNMGAMVVFGLSAVASVVVAGSLLYAARALLAGNTSYDQRKRIDRLRAGHGAAVPTTRPAPVAPAPSAWRPAAPVATSRRGPRASAKLTMRGMPPLAT